jgi:predicted chitinase
MRAQEFIFVEDQLDEGWKETVAQLGLLGFLAGAGTTGLTVRQALTSPDISDTKKAVIAVKANIPDSQLPSNISSKIPTAKEIIANTPELAQPVKKELPSTTQPPTIKQPKIQTLTAQPNENLLKKFAESQGIVGVELAAFLSQCAHETANFTELVERASGHAYEPIFKTDKQTKKPIVDPRTGKPVNFNSTAVRLGNTQIGDGAKFKGRGFIHLTGRDNYRMASQGVFGDDRLLKNPELAADPQLAARIAVWYWANRVQNRVADFKDVRAVTYPINSSLAGLESRYRIFNNYLQSSGT